MPYLTYCNSTASKISHLSIQLHLTEHCVADYLDLCQTIYATLSTHTNSFSNWTPIIKTTLSSSISLNNSQPRGCCEIIWCAINNNFMVLAMGLKDASTLCIRLMPQCSLPLYDLFSPSIMYRLVKNILITTCSNFNLNLCLFTLSLLQSDQRQTCLSCHPL